MILGLDIASRTGWALYDGHRIKAIRAGSFDCAGNDRDRPHEVKAAAMADHLISLLKDERARGTMPTFAIIEQPQRNVQQFRKQGTRMMPEATGGMTVNAGTALLLNQLVGAAVAILTGYGIPFETVPVKTWRSSFFGKGTKAQDRAEWKRLAKERCRLLGIEVRNSDAAEAVGVAVYGAGTQTWRALRHEIEQQAEKKAAEQRALAGINEVWRGAA